MSARGSGWAIWVIVLALVAAACGGEDGDGDGGQASAPPTESQSAAADAAASEQADDGAGGSDGAQTYVVRSGDTLSQIANRFDTTVPALVQANNIADPDVIDVGQELTIP
jgi:LysM repeat protein